MILRLLLALLLPLTASAALVANGGLATLRSLELEGGARALLILRFEGKPVLSAHPLISARRLVIEFGYSAFPERSRSFGRAGPLEHGTLEQRNGLEVQLALTFEPGTRISVYQRTVPGTNEEEYALLCEAPPPAGLAGAIAWPVHGRLSSKFGWRMHPILGVGKMHSGVDLAVKSGTPIECVAAGTVVFAGTRGHAGLCVVVDHGGGVRSSYGHCSKLLVKAGEAVAARAVLARAGSTGLSTGPHVHFAMTRDGRAIDPAAFLGGKATDRRTPARTAPSPRPAPPARAR